MESGERAPVDGVAPGPGGRQLDEPLRRPLTGWDLLGVALTALGMLGVQRVITAVIDTPMGRLPQLTAVAVALGVISLALGAHLVRRAAPGDRLGIRDVLREVTAVWTDPPGPWAAAVLGFLLATPVLALYTPVLLGDADSQRLIAAVTYVQAHGPAYLVETQHNLLPHALLGPSIWLGGVAAAKLFTLLSLQALAGASAYVSYGISRSMLGAAATALALVAIPAALQQGGFVPMYPTMLALGYVGGWFAYRGVTGHGRWSAAIAGGACLALCPEAQAVGVLFVPVPVLLLVFARTWRSALAATARTYAVMAVVGLPRIIIDTMDGGLDRIGTYRTDYWITKGYIHLLQSEFWGYDGIDESLGDYLRLLPWRFADSLGPQGFVVLGLAFVAWLASCRPRGRAFVVFVIGYVVLALSIKQVPPFQRYYSYLWPGLAILVGLGVAPSRSLGTADRHRLAVLALLAVIAVAAVVSVAHSQDRRRAKIDRSPFHQLAAAITDGKGVIGSRSLKLINVTADIPTWGGQFLTEGELVTYLTWPSDDAVIEMMKRRDIGWVLIDRNRRLETAYHDTWLIPTYNRAARHVARVSNSPAFCRTLSVDGFVLYRLGPCAAPGGARSGAD